MTNNMGLCYFLQSKIENLELLTLFINLIFSISSANEGDGFIWLESI